MNTKLLATNPTHQTSLFAPSGQLRLDPRLNALHLLSAVDTIAQLPEFGNFELVVNIADPQKPLLMITLFHQRIHDKPAPDKVQYIDEPQLHINISHAGATVYFQETRTLPPIPNLDTISALIQNLHGHSMPQLQINRLQDLFHQLNQQLNQKKPDFMSLNVPNLMQPYELRLRQNLTQEALNKALMGNISDMTLAQLFPEFSWTTELDKLNGLCLNLAFDPRKMVIDVDWLSPFALELQKAKTQTATIPAILAELAQTGLIDVDQHLAADFPQELPDFSDALRRVGSSLEKTLGPQLFIHLFNSLKARDFKMTLHQRGIWFNHVARGGRLDKTDFTGPREFLEYLGGIVSPLQLQRFRAFICFLHAWLEPPFRP